jgi:hypothetical protein
MTEHEERPMSAIEAYLRGGEPDPSVRASVQELGDAGDAAAVPALKQVAGAASTEYSRIGFDAMDALFRLGEARDYFLDVARAHRDNKGLAYHAIVVLGRDATDDEVWDVLHAIRQETTDADLLGAIASAERVRYLEDHYQGLPNPHDCLSYALAALRTDWNLLTRSGGDTDRGSDPQAIWSQRKLRELSARDPVGAAQAVAALDRGGLSGRDLWRYRRFVAGFLAGAAQEDFRRLDPGEGD